MSKTRAKQVTQFKRVQRRALRHRANIRRYRAMANLRKQAGGLSRAPDVSPKRLSPLAQFAQRAVRDLMLASQQAEPQAPDAKRKVTTRRGA